MQRRVDDSTSSVDYFLGAIIVAKRSNGAPYELVDGQQRLASLSAILAVLRDQLPENKRAQIQEHLIRPANDLRGIEESPRVALRDLENDSFSKWVHTPNGTRRLPEIGGNEVENRLLQAIRKVKEDFDSADDLFTEGLARFILNHSHFIVITAGSVDDAYKLFRSVNNLGEPLTDADFARAELLGAEGLSDGERARLCDAWGAAEDELGLDDLRAYIETVAEIVMPEAHGEVLLTKLRLITARADRITLFRRRLGEFLTSYVKLKSASLSFGHDSAEINRIVRCLLALENDDWMPLALLWLTDHHSGAETHRFFRALDSLMYGITVLGVSKSERTKRLGRIKAGIAEGWVVSRATSDIYLKDREIERLKSILEKPIPANKTYLKPLLLRLNAEMTDRAFQPLFPENLTLEHVLPQRPKANSIWMQKFPDPTRRKHLSECLGNYALLTQRMNPTGSNSDFARKKQIYFDFRDHQNFALTAQIVRYDDWDEHVILERQRELIQLASRIFNPLLAAPVA